MAERRMFAKSVVSSDAFISLSPEARLLYFCLGMAADDDGAVNSALGVLREQSLPEAALTELVRAGFLLRLEAQGVFVIAHWKVSNYVPKDRYRASRYRAAIDEAYELSSEGVYVSSLDTDCIQGVHSLDTDCIQGVHSLDTDCIQGVHAGKDRSGKDRSGKDRSGKDTSCPELAELQKPRRSDPPGKSRAQPPLETAGIRASGDQDAEGTAPFLEEASRQSRDLSLCLPLTKNRAVDIPPSWLAEMQAAYPNVDAVAEARKAVAWCKANPKRLKSDWKRFLNGWLSKANDTRGPGAGTAPADRIWSGRYDAVPETDFSKEVKE